MNKINLSLTVSELTELYVVLGNRIIDLRNDSSPKTDIYEKITVRQLDQAHSMCSQIQEILSTIYCQPKA